MDQTIMLGVHEYGENYPVKLSRDEYHPFSPLSIVATNEGGNNSTAIDLCDLIEWMKYGPPSMRAPGIIVIPVMEETDHGSVIEGTESST